MKLYGIPNCDTVKKARVYLTTAGVEYQFQDYKKIPFTEALLADWIKQIGWQKLLKKTGPTWAKLTDETKASLTDDASALAVMLQYPNIIKRPVLVHEGKVLATGFNQTEYINLKL